MAMAGGSHGRHRARKRPLVALPVLWCGLSGAVVGCSSAVNHSDCASVYGGDTSLTTWWRPVVTEEGLAQQSLVDGYLRCSGGEVTVEPAAADKEETLFVYEEQERHLLLVNGLTDIDRLECTPNRGSGLFALKDMDGLRWDDRIPTFLQPYVRPCLGEKANRLYAVPVGLHTLNRTLINPQFANTFAASDLTLDGFVEALERASQELQAKPIVIPADTQPSYLLVENLMVAVAGERYLEFWNLDRRTQTEAEIDMAPFAATLDYTDRLLPYIEFVEGDDPTRAALARVCDGRAALTVQADWVDAAHYCERELVTAAFPGTSKYSVFAFDAFAVDYSEAQATQAGSGRYLPEGAAEYAWLKAVTSAEVQHEYARLKRSKTLVESDGVGNTVARDQADVFGAGVTPLPGLMLLVEHETFVSFASNIAQYLGTPVADTATLDQRKLDLIDYVHTELCKATSCKPSGPKF